MVGKLLPDRFTFEISWEVCNKVGGINTVIRSKAAVTVSELGEDYFLLGPYVEEKMRTEVEIEEPENFYVRAAIDAMRSRGIKVVTGTWLIEGSPKVILFDLDSAGSFYNEWMTDFWNVTHIGVPDHDTESRNCIMFGELVCWFLGEFSVRYHRSKRIVAHFHEWQAGVACILARTRGIEIATIFTTHATILGRYLCAGSSDFYNNMPYFDCEGEARRRGIHHRYCIEMASCHAAHVFTTVSRITQDESEHLLKRRPDIITPNGLNVEKFSATHEFQNLHALAKQKIHNFVQGHFYGHLDFDLDNVVYMFSAGRNEYFNKGVDLYLESLAKLNYYLKVENADTTVVAFLIFPDSTNNYNIDSLNGQAQHKKLREGVEKIQQKIGEKIFESVLRGQMPPEKLLTRDDEVLLKNYLYKSKRTTLPPIVTHNLVHEERSDIMNHIKKIRLFNNSHDKVKIIYHPEFLSSTSPLFSLEYSEFVRGCHLGVFPSYYEPWGYTPAECTVMGIPSITTNLSGFGCFMAEHIADPTSYGIYIVDRRFKSPGESVEQLAQQMLSFSKQTRRQRIIQRNRTERLSDLLDWNSLGMYYVRARHMSLKALDVTYQIPVLDSGDDVLIQDFTQHKRSGSFSYPRPASQPPSPSHSRRSSVDMESDEEDDDRKMIEDITRKFLLEGGEHSQDLDTEHNKERRRTETLQCKEELRQRPKSHSLGHIMDMKHNVLGEAMGKVKAKENKRNLLKEINDLSAVRPSEKISLIEVKQHDNILKTVNKEITDISETKNKKLNLLKEVEDRGDTKDKKTVMLGELSKISQLKEHTGVDENINLVNIQTEMKKKCAALNEIQIIGESKEKKEEMQRELTTISTMRDAKADAMREIRDRTDTKEKKHVVMEDIAKMKQVKDARCKVLHDINQIGNINTTVFNHCEQFEPLPKVLSSKLSVINEINEIGQLKEAKSDALKELVIVHHTKTSKAAAMEELKGVAQTKSKKADTLQEIKDKANSKEAKNQAMSELLKVNHIKELVEPAGELPQGVAEKQIGVHSNVMKDIEIIGKQKDTKQDVMMELVTISTTKEAKKSLVGEIKQIGQARTAKEEAQCELKTIVAAKTNKHVMQTELKDKQEEKCKQGVLSEIAEKGKEKERGLQSVEDLMSARGNQQTVLGEIRDIGKSKDQGIKNVEQLFAAKSTHADLMGEVRHIKEEKEEGTAAVEKLLEARSSKTGAMAEIRQIKEDKEKGLEQLEATLGKRAAAE